jgi:regulator of protease activity HflC (stomatin/prohibitin superfamily)
MPDNEVREPPTPKTRMFPFALLIAATIFFYILSSYGKGVIFFSLGELALTISLFLVLMTVFYEIKKLDPVKIKALFRKLHKADTKKELVVELPDELDELLVETEEVLEVETPASDGLIEIQKETVSVQSQEKTNLFLRICEISFVIFFFFFSFWRILRMLTLMHVPVTVPRYGIVGAVLLLVFPCIAVIYLKMRKDTAVGPCPGDKTSHDVLTLFSYVSFIYAAVIAASSALKVNFLIVLPWIYCIASVYLVGALALNVLFSILKNNVLGDFNYTLIPQISKTKSKNKKDGLLDTEEVRQNFSLKSLYTIKYAVKVLPGVLLCLGFILFLSTTLFVVQPHQQALVYRLGKLTGHQGEGIHFKLPWPIDKADIYDIRRVNSMQIGYQAPYSANYLWTRAHDGGENMLLTGNGNEMVAVNIKIMYTITDLYRYVKTCTNPEAILNAAAYEALMNRTVDTTLDEFLSVDRSSLSASVADELEEFCTANGLGLSIQQIIVESIHPPVDVADFYQRVVTSIIVKNTLVTRAETEAAQKIIEAQRENRSAIYNALARRHNRVSEAQKEMAVYYAAMEAYAINPRALELVKYVNTYEKIISGNKVYVFSPGMEASIAKSVIGKANVIGVTNE